MRPRQLCNGMIRAFQQFAFVFPDTSGFSGQDGGFSDHRVDFDFHIGLEVRRCIPCIAGVGCCEQPFGSGCSRQCAETSQLQELATVNAGCF